MFNFWSDLKEVLFLLGQNLPAILIIMGIFNLMLAITGELIWISVPEQRQRFLGSLGAIIALVGIGLYAEAQMCPEERRLQEILDQIKVEEAKLTNLMSQEVTAEERLLASERQRLAAQAATKQAEMEKLHAIEAKNAAELAEKLAKVRFNDIDLQQKTDETAITNLQIELNAINKSKADATTELNAIKSKLDATKTELEAVKNQLAAVKVPLIQPTPKVTAGLITDRYRDNGDGSVTDVTTNLMWKRCSEGQTWNGNTCIGDASEITWNNVMSNEKHKTWPKFAEYDDWRMPTREELRTLVWCSNGKIKEWSNSCKVKNDYYQTPTIDITSFPNTPSELFWALPVRKQKCYLHFKHGGGWCSKSIDVKCHIRLMRGGK